MSIEPADILSAGLLAGMLCFAFFGFARLSFKDVVRAVFGRKA